MVFSSSLVYSSCRWSANNASNHIAQDFRFGPFFGPFLGGGVWLMTLGITGHNNGHNDFMTSIICKTYEVHDHLTHNHTLRHLRIE